MESLDKFIEWHEQQSQKLANEEMIINYQGRFEEDFIHGLVDIIEFKVLSLKCSYDKAQRVFASISESLTNINTYAESEITRNGSIFLWFKNKKFYVTVSNIIENKSKDRLIDRLVDINELERETLEDRYLELKKRSIVSNSGGLGIGLIFIRKCSSGRLNYQFEKLNEQESIFTLSYEVLCKL